MSYLRRLPSGLWQATVRGPDGRKHTYTHALKSAVKAWGAEQEAQVARGEYRDPRLGQIRVGDWYARVAAARVLEDVTKPKNASLWRTHCEPAWARWPLAAVTRMEAQEWVNRLRLTRRARHQGKPVTRDQDVPVLSPATIADVVHLMSNLYRLAMREHPPLVTTNPFGDLTLPRRVLPPPQFLDRDEADALYAALEAIGPQWRVLGELGTEVGLRVQELFGLHGHRVAWMRARIEVVDVMTRAGLRQWPKSRKSHRVVPVPPQILEDMSALMAGRPLEAVVFTAPEGGPVTDVHFRNRVWNPAVAAAGVRRFPPRVMRHTAASWLVQDGVPLTDVQALLGHESYSTTERYAHLAPGVHDKVTESWSRRRLGASVAHNGKEARPS